MQEVQILLQNSGRASAKPQTYSHDDPAMRPAPDKDGEAIRLAGEVLLSASRCSKLIR